MIRVYDGVMRQGAVVSLLLSMLVTSPAAQAEEPPGQPTQQTVTGIEVEYRWPRWIPWTVVGVGLGGGLFGVLLQVDARDRMIQYDQRVAASCAVNGCNFQNPQTEQERVLVAELNAQRESAERRHTISLVTMAGAGAAFVTGVVLVVLNRPTIRAVKVDVTPVQGGATGAVSWRF